MTSMSCISVVMSLMGLTSSKRVSSQSLSCPKATSLKKTEDRKFLTCISISALEPRC